MDGRAQTFVGPMTMAGTEVAGKITAAGNKIAMAAGMQMAMTFCISMVPGENTATGGTKTVGITVTGVEAVGNMTTVGRITFTAGMVTVGMKAAGNITMTAMKRDTVLMAAAGMNATGRKTRLGNITATAGLKGSKTEKMMQQMQKFLLMMKTGTSWIFKVIGDSEGF